VFLPAVNELVRVPPFVDGTFHFTPVLCLFLRTLLLRSQGPLQQPSPTSHLLAPFDLTLTSLLLSQIIP
jgi:hypothetical protein